MLGKRAGKTGRFRKTWRPDCDPAIVRGPWSVVSGRWPVSSGPWSFFLPLSLWERAGVRGLHAGWSVATDNRPPDDE